jgi:hypothetical protein
VISFSLSTTAADNAFTAQHASMPRISDKKRFERDLDTLFTLDAIFQAIRGRESERFWRSQGLEWDNGCDINRDFERRRAEAFGETWMLDSPFDWVLPSTFAIPAVVRPFLDMAMVVLPQIRYMSPRDPLPRGEDPFSWLVHHMPEDRFKSFFRMSRYAFVQVADMIRSHQVFQNNLKIPKQTPRSSLPSVSFGLLRLGRLPYVRRLLSALAMAPCICSLPGS